MLSVNVPGSINNNTVNLVGISTRVNIIKQILVINASITVT